MAEVQDLYSVLGVNREASGEEIKRAYRRLARELHPDVNRDPSAGERFKQVTAAYEVLSDPAKRRQYDTFGGQAVPDLFPFGDIFEAFFGQGFGRSRTRSRPTRSQRGDDVYVHLVLTLQEAAFGLSRDIPIESLEVCGLCGGTGCEPGTYPARCSRCGGSGEVQEVQRSLFGTIMSARTCPACGGAGEQVVSPCPGCGGDGRVGRRQSVSVEVPAGVSDGMELRITGTGNAGRAGGPPGDLFVAVSVEPHPVFARQGQDLHAVLEVPMATASLGGEVEVEALDGTEKVKLAAGTQSGEVVRLRGKGVPHLGRRGRGDLYLSVHVLTPEGLRKEERQLVERLAELRGERPRKGEPHPGRLRNPEA